MTDIFPCFADRTETASDGIHSVLSAAFMASVLCAMPVDVRRLRIPHRILTFFLRLPQKSVRYLNGLSSYNAVYLQNPEITEGGTKMSIDSDLEKWLDEGEAVQWSGSPQPYGLLDEGHKTATLISWFWAAAWGIFLVGGYYALCISRNLEIKTSAMVICAIVPLFIFWSPTGDKNRIKKLRYAITNKRILVVAAGSTGSDKPCTLPLTAIGTVRVEKAGKETCNLRLGPSTFRASARKLPALAIRGNFDTNANNERIYNGLVFYNIINGDGEAAGDLLKPYAVIEGDARQ
jgi:hypothetical protein